MHSQAENKTESSVVGTGAEYPSSAGPNSRTRRHPNSLYRKVKNITVNLGTPEPEAFEAFLWYLAGLIADDILAEDQCSKEGTV